MSLGSQREFGKRQEETVRRDRRKLDKLHNVIPVTSTPREVSLWSRDTFLAVSGCPGGAEQLGIRH